MSRYIGLIISSILFILFLIFAIIFFYKNDKYHDEHHYSHSPCFITCGVMFAVYSSIFFIVMLAEYYSVV